MRKGREEGQGFRAQNRLLSGRAYAHTLMGRVRIGISGWNYPEWHGPFYPRDLPRSRELEYASRRFESIELNGSFYSLKRPDDYREWYEQTPAGFTFSVKGSRFITHNKKLKDVATPLANFFASGVLLLKEKLGPFIWQLPSNARFDAQRIAEFFDLLPHDTRQASRLAGRHDSRMKGRSWTGSDATRRLRHAIEIRNGSFFAPEFVGLARRFGVAIVFSDAADWPYTEEITAGFVYLRLHGADETYASSYSDHRLKRWAGRVRQWRAGSEPGDAERITEREPPRRRSRDAYVYFDNDRHAHAPRNALRLIDLFER